MTANGNAGGACKLYNGSLQAFIKLEKTHCYHANTPFNAIADYEKLVFRFHNRIFWMRTDLSHYDRFLHTLCFDFKKKICWLNWKVTGQYLTWIEAGWLLLLKVTVKDISFFVFLDVRRQLWSSNYGVSLNKHKVRWLFKTIL